MYLTFDTKELNEFKEFAATKVYPLRLKTRQEKYRFKVLSSMFSFNDSQWFFTNRKGEKLAFFPSDQLKGKTDFVLLKILMEFKFIIHC